MIKINVKKENNKITNINITGHAMYDVIGKDIVCSAVSSIVITTINGILSIDDKAIEYEKSNNGLQIKDIDFDDVTQKLLNNMIELLEELSNQYKENIEIK
ncbi:MAG: ribosomal-processing cysteine protease Prp [Bacilli bacterium]|nr:ribosomal-processing cysteine protease Prp [Bacilli bacterium]